MVTLGGNVVKIIISATDRASAVVDGVKGKLGGLTGAMNKMRGPMLAVGVAAVAGMGLAIKAYVDFEKEMANVTTLMEAGANANEVYGDTVHRLGEEYAVAGGKAGIAASLYQVVSAGFGDAADAANVLEEAVKASIGGSVDASVAITGLTQVLNAYGMEADEASHVSDIMFQTVAKGVTTYGELGSALSTVLPTAAALGVNFETVSAALATLTQQGLSASESTVALNMMMLAFLKPSEDMSLALNQIAAEQGMLTIEVQDATDDYIAQQAELDALTMAYTETTEAVAGMSAELDDMGDAMAVNRVKIQEIRLTARKQGRELTEGEEADIDRIKLANEELSLSYNKLRIKQDDLQETQEEQKNSMEAQKDVFKASGEVLKEVSKTTGENLLKTLDFATVLKLLGEKAEGSTTKMAKFFNQIRGLKGALGLTGDNAENFAEKLEDMTDAEGAAANATEVMSGTMEYRFKEVMQSVDNLAIKIGEALVPVLEMLVPIIEKAVEIFASLDPVIQASVLIIGMLVGAFALVLPAISALVGLLGPAGLAGVVGTLTGPIGWVILAIGLLAAAWITNFGGIRDITEDVFETVVPIFEKLMNLLGRIAGILIDVFGPAFEEIFGFVSDVLFLAWETVFKPVFEWIMEYVGLVIDTFDALLSALEGDLGPLQNILGRWKTFFYNTFTGIINAARNFVTDLWNKIVTGIRNIGNWMYTAGRNIIWGLIRGLKSIGWKIANTILGFIPSMTDITNAVLGMFNWGGGGGGNGNNNGDGEAGDFIYRAGQGIKKFSSLDNLIGVKDLAGLVEGVAVGGGGGGTVTYYIENVNLSADYTFDDFKRDLAEDEKDAWANKQNK